LPWNARPKYKNEFVAGEVFAVSGASARHARLASKVLSKLDLQLEVGGCTAVNSDLRIRTPQGDQFYPDVSVICGPIETHAGNKDICINPVVIVEVLSPSTANYDRGIRFVLYREIPSLSDYLIFHWDAVHVEHYSRQPGDSWLLQHYHGKDARIQLPSIQCELSSGSIYAGAFDWPG
jgi:Uma2 family endonuclease